MLTFKIQDKIQDLKTKYAYLEREITFLKHNTNILERHNLVKYLEIIVIPKIEKESLIEIVNTIFNTISLKF